MYPKFRLLVLITVFAVLKLASSDCGCSLNRDGQCSSDENEIKSSKKYSKELNSNENTQETFDLSNMILIKRATFEMGTNKPVFSADYEGPARNITITKDFYLDKYEVSNQNFYDFVRDTGYETEAETFGDSFLFEMSLPESQRDLYQDIRAAQAPWWIKLKGVTWKHPEGPDSSIEGNN